jgi:hypothetical protein
MDHAFSISQSCGVERGRVRSADIRAAVRIRTHAASIMAGSCGRVLAHCSRDTDSGRTHLCAPPTLMRLPLMGFGQSASGSVVRSPQLLRNLACCARANERAGRSLSCG